MSRLSMRRGLRSAVYAAPKKAAAAFTPASIPGTLLWIDPADDSTITYSSGSTPSAIADKGYLNTGWSITGDTLSSQSFSFSGNYYSIGSISGKGNGNNFIRFDPSGNSRTMYATNTPTGSPYNLTSGAGSAAIESDWFLWQVMYIEGPAGSGTRGSYFMRGYEGQSPAELTKVSSSNMTCHVRGSWVNSTRFRNVPGETNPWGYVSFIGCQCHEISGDRYFKFTQDGVNWTGLTHVGRTNATPSAAANIWRIEMDSSVDSGLSQGMGDVGFVSGTISAEDMKALYDYLDAKWGFDLP